MRAALLDGGFGHCWKKVIRLYKDALFHSPSLILIDNVDVFFSGETEMVVCRLAYFRSRSLS